MTGKTGGRKPRAQDTRKAAEETKLWKPPSALDAPECPDDMVQRWVRIESRGADDLKNASARHREGYRPVMKKDHPDFDAPTIDEGKYAGVIGVGGLILMRIPKTVSDARRAYFRNQTEGALQAVDENMMRENAHDTMRIEKASRKTKVTFGGS